jgi:hypothetical protein
MTFCFWPQALRLLLRLGKDLGSAAERVLEAWLKVPFSAALRCCGRRLESEIIHFKYGIYMIYIGYIPI